MATLIAPSSTVDALLRAAEMPLGVASLVDIETFLDQELEDDDDDEEEDP